MEAQGTAKTVIAEDIEITGAIKSTGNIRFDGKLNGDLTCAANAVIGASAQIKGNINVESVSLEGQVNGNITARDRIELKSTARLNGDIRSKRLTVEDGVTFIGKSEVNPSGTAAPKPAADAGETGSDEGGPDKARGGAFPKK